MDTLKMIPIYKGQFNYTYNQYKREQKARNYLKQCANRKSQKQASIFAKVFGSMIVVITILLPAFIH